MDVAEVVAVTAVDPWVVVVDPWADVAASGAAHQAWVDVDAEAWTEAGVVAEADLTGESSSYHFFF